MAGVAGVERLLHGVVAVDVLVHPGEGEVEHAAHDVDAHEGGATDE